MKLHGVYRILNNSLGSLKSFPPSLIFFNFPAYLILPNVPTPPRLLDPPPPVYSGTKSKSYWKKTLIASSRNWLTFYDRKILKSSTPFCTDFNVNWDIAYRIYIYIYIYIYIHIHIISGQFVAIYRLNSKIYTNFIFETSFFEAYSKPCQTSKMEIFAEFFFEMYSGFQSLNIFAKSSSLDVWQGFEYTLYILLLFLSFSLLDMINDPSRRGLFSKRWNT